MSINPGGAWSKSKVRKPPSREEPSGRCLTICQCPRAMRYWQTNNGSPPNTPPPPSTAVRRNVFARRRAALIDRACPSVDSGQHDGRRGRHLVLAQKLHQEHLVGATDHRDRIVDDRHAFLPGAPGKAVSVIVDRGGLANEKTIVFGELGKLASRDRLDID